jgi:phosphoribosylanthranilate isomerase
MTTRVKVCGITRVEDAALAADLGASAIGFIFWPRSARFIEPARAAAIAASLPSSVVCVGVFVDQPVEDMQAIASQVPLGAVQLHGAETPAVAAALMQPVIKAVPVTDVFDPQSMDAWPAEVTVLLDAHDPVKRGGTGRTIDWSLAARAARRRRVMLSGGLNPDNVRAAVAAVRPYAIDLSSGVESAPGIKDPVKLRALFAALPGLSTSAEATADKKDPAY